jgi:hypothetical protein
VAGLRNGAAPNAQSAGVRRLVALAYVLAVSVPPFGLILGIALVLRSGRRYSMHGLGVIALSVMASIVWIVIVTSGALNTPTTGY